MNRDKHVKPGSPEWTARLNDILAEEAQQPPQFWYLSFVDPARPDAEQFLGACVIWEHGMTRAIRKAHSLGINPGGQVMSFAVGTGKPPIPINRLLSKAELGPGAKTVGELERLGMLPGAHVRFTD